MRSIFKYLGLTIRYPAYTFSIITGRLRLLVLYPKFKRWSTNIEKYFSGKYGLEIGGPSGIFGSKLLGIYELANLIDGCNYSNNTIWEGHIGSNEYRFYPGKIGRQFILDGADLNLIADETYDFILSSHNLEHIANPLKALKEWKRVLKPSGVVLLILPDKKSTFDHKRDYTSFQHLVDDFIKGIDETDLTHLEEVISLHDLSFDPPAERDHEKFKLRCMNNFKTRSIHHHVYNFNLLRDMLLYLDMDPITNILIPPYHQVMIGKKR